MFKHKKLTLILLIGIVLLTASGTPALTESVSGNTEQIPPAAPPEKQNAQEPAPVQAETSASSTAGLTYPIVDTNQGNCYDANNQRDCPQTGSAFFGQDAQYNGNQPNYTDNGDSTVTDNVTGLMWQQDPGEKMTYSQAVAGASDLTLAGYSDWRLPSIKELYSLIQFDGLDPSGPNSTDLVPFMDLNYFNFEYGDESAGERVIDSQWATSTKYVSTTMNGNETMFGVNFADGRIKGYPANGRANFFVIYVRGNTSYGINDFVDNGNSTVSDLATGLTWTKSDSASGMNWEAALNYCESLDTAGITDWRLPNVKELQSIVDYSRSPDTTNSAAVDPIFGTSTITNEAGQNDYPFFWSSTTHENQHSGGNASYVSFGRAMGNMNGRWMDVHGAGAQRSDPKTGSAADWPDGHGPQGDARRVDNYVRCVTDSTTSTNVNGNPSAITGVAETNTQPPAGQPAQGQSETHTEDAAGDVSYLFSPIRSTSTFLMNAEGEVVFTWESSYMPGQSVYLLENGNLLRTGSDKSQTFTAGGAGGIVEEIAPDGTVVWSFQYANDLVQQHHDIEKLPNGNILLVAWEYKSQAEAINAGRSPDLVKDGAIWADHIIEVDPSTNSIVWEWHVWDHLIQDHDSTKENYGVVADHPERIDLNFTNRLADADWNHTNSIDYNAELDQILVSVHNFSEIWIIDHSISTQEAAGNAGDLLYRWGNPQTYDAGTAADQQLFSQHDAQWIPDGHSGVENILVFNNGNKQTRPYSSVDEIAPPLNADGSYALTSSAYGPEVPTWTYTADNPSDFYADHISGAQRLSNENTLICSGPDGLFFEVTSAGEIVWRYDYGAEVFRVTRYEEDYAGLPE